MYCNAQLYAETCPTVIWTGTNRGWVEIRVVDGPKKKEQKMCSKTIDIVSNVLEVSVNGVMCS